MDIIELSKEKERYIYPTVFEINNESVGKVGYIPDLQHEMKMINIANYLKIPVPEMYEIIETPVSGDGILIMEKIKGTEIGYLKENDLESAIKQLTHHVTTLLDNGILPEDCFFHRNSIYCSESKLYLIDAECWTQDKIFYTVLEPKYRKAVKMLNNKKVDLFQVRDIAH